MKRQTPESTSAIEELSRSGEVYLRSIGGVQRKTWREGNIKTVDSAVVAVGVSVSAATKRTRSRTDHVICGHIICAYFGRVRSGAQNLSIQRKETELERSTSHLLINEQASSFPTSTR